MHVPSLAGKQVNRPGIRCSHSVPGHSEGNLKHCVTDAQRIFQPVPDYDYTCIDLDGKEFGGCMEADSELHVEEAIRSRGYYLIGITRRRPPAGPIEARLDRAWRALIHGLFNWWARPLTDYFENKKYGTVSGEPGAETSTPVERFLDVIFEQMIEDGAPEVRFQYRNGMVTRTLPNGTSFEQTEPISLELEWLLNGSWERIPSPPPRWASEIICMLRGWAGMDAGSTASGTFIILVGGAERQVAVRISEDAQGGRADLRMK